MNDATLLEYGIRELAAFREDKHDMLAYIAGDTGEAHSTRSRVVGNAIRDVIRSGDERRDAAGLTRSQAERACQLAAMVERYKAQP